MVQRLAARKIPVIIYDPVFPPDFYQWDRVHLTADAHAKIATELLPQVARIIKPKEKPKEKAPPAKRR